MKEAIYIAGGGAVGAILRYLISGVAYRVLGIGFPWGTLGVNLIGTFLIGFLWGIFERIVILPEVKVFIFIGFLGAFTTFSTYAFETLNLLKEGELKMALFNILANNVLGIFLVFLGILTSKYLIFLVEKG